MSETQSISAGIAQRYATALFDLARDDGGIDKLEADIEALGTAIGDSAELRDLMHSPVYPRDEATAAVGAVADAMGLSPLTGNTLRLMASNRRLFVVPAFLRALAEKIADHKGEVTAEVTTAKALTDTQSKKLAETLKAAVGKDVKINQTVDESLIGGLVVKVGSKMIDTSIRSKLAALKNSMKEVG
ncbi:F0F1 ATP synthase subunit delta [Rhodobacterales bacterium HKCCE2091]|nr:F0F1 ATP synthase subunit delta [Rhodobacterales bacterium HKCCE2091]